jgi:protocatechuate 3,4-dioxygenase beta subunit
MRSATLSLAAVLLAAAAHAAISGIVIDENGKPIAGATVRAWAAEPSRAYRQRILSAQPENDPLATATTNDAGAFSVDTKGAVAVDLRVDKDGRRTASIDAVDGEEPLTVILRPPLQRKVMIEGGGEPVANALVVFGPHLMTKTNAAGEAPMLDDTIGLIIHPDRAVSVRPQPRIAPMMKVKLERGITLRGHVLNAKGAAVKADLFIGGVPVATSGDDGAFTIAHAPSNWQSLVAAAGNQAAVVSHTEARTVDLHLAPAMTVNGTLRDEAGRAAGGGRVTLRVQGPDGAAYDVAIADAKGNFAFDPVPPRGYALFASHPAYTFDSLPVQAGEGSNRLMVAHALARVRGRVVDAQGKPVAGAFISNGGFGGRPNTITDAAGRFSLRLAPPSQGMQLTALTAVKRGYATGSSPRRRLKSGESVDDIVITMAAGFPLQVRVVDSKRQPVPGVMVNANGTDDETRAFVSCDDPWQDNCRVTDAKGIVTLRMTEGQYAFSVNPSGQDSQIAPRRIAAQPISAKSSPLVIEVENGVAIRGKVAYSDGTPLADVSIELRGGGNINRDEQAPDGNFEITGLAAGKYTLTATTNDGHMSTPAVEVTAPAANVVLTMPRGGRIEGRVTERGSGKPVTDFVAAPLRGVNFRPPADRETHSDDGSFAIDNVPAGTASIRVSARGYVPATRADIQVEEGRAVTGIDVQLDRGAKLTGRVTSDGKPLPGVTVRATPLTAPSPIVAGTVTDGDGQYTLDGLSAGQPAIEFRKQGYVVKRQNVEIAAAKDAHLDVELESGRALRGRVVDKNGAGIEGATVVAYAAGFGGMPEQAVSSGDGSFAIEGLGESHYNVQVRKSGFVGTSERDVALPQSAPLLVTLDRGGTVTGRVTGLSPSELGMVYVSVSGGNGSYASAQTDATGAFTLRGVPDGQLTASAGIVGGDRRSKPKTFVVENGAAPPLEINFDEGYTVRGRVMFNGVPTANGFINFRSREPMSGGSARVIAGAYEITGLAAGDYDVNMTSAEGSYRGKYTVSGSGTFDIDVRGATLRGHVVDAQSGQPVADASISLSGKGSTAFSNAMSDSDGRFVVPALIDGTYTLSVRRETYSPANQSVEVSGGTAPDVEVRLEGGTAVTVLVFDAITGTSLPMANVVIDQNGKRTAGGMARGDDGARIWLAPGDYVASATSYEYVPSHVSFTVPGPAVRIGMSRGGSLVIVARSAGRARLVSSTTSFVGTGGGITTSVSRPITFVAGPNMPIDALTPGAYTLEVVDGKGTVLKRLPVTIVSAQTTTVSVE